MNNEMEKLLMEEENLFQEVNKGKIVRGKILIEKEDCYYVDLSYKTDGVLPKSEMLEDETLAIGDQVDLQVLKIDKNSGEVILSKRRVDEFKVWDDIKVGDIVEVKVSEKNPKGLIVKYKDGLRGFMPLSHIEMKYLSEEELDKYLGQKMDVEIIDLDQKKRRFVVSRKNILKKENDTVKKDLIQKLENQKVFKGTVKEIMDYGAFVDIGGITGLVHISELSWDRKEKVSDLLSIGQEVEVKVLDFDENKGRLSLSIKSLQSNPWDQFIATHKEEDVVNGEVKNVKEYGIFVNLAPTVDGFVHISNISSDFVKNPKEVVSAGQKVEVKILKIDVENKKIELTMNLSSASLESAE